MTNERQTEITEWLINVCYREIFNGVQKVFIEAPNDVYLYLKSFFFWFNKT